MNLLADQAQTLAVAQVTWVEAHATFARLVRETPSRTDHIQAVKSNFKKYWQSYRVIQTSPEICELAADFADTFAQRAYDSVQLATAHTLARLQDSPVLFASFDHRLNKAAKLLGLKTL
jgi:uncharacterized protein